MNSPREHKQATAPSSPAFATRTTYPTPALGCGGFLPAEEEEEEATQVVFSTNLDHLADDLALDSGDASATPTFRDVGAVFAGNGPDDLFLHGESFLETSLFGSKATPVFVLEKTPATLPLGPGEALVSINSKHITSPSSPSSYQVNIEIPQKSLSCGFYSCRPTIPSHHTPTKIMETVKRALTQLKCEFRTEAEWTVHAACLLVAEEIAFTVQLYKLSSGEDQYEVEFIYRMGDELKFAELTECIRSQCADIDSEAMIGLFSNSLDAWLDSQKDLVGRRFAIKAKEAKTLIQELNSTYLHPDVVYEIAKSVKNHCRHKGNRNMFLEADRKQFLKALEWMLNDCDELARYALFVLLQFARDTSECTSFFSSAFEKSTFSLLLDDLLSRETGSNFTTKMVEEVRSSVLFV